MDSGNGVKLDPFKDISLNGDLILVIGERKARLRVHSPILSCASKVFSVMFGPNWSEGKDLSKEFPKEVTLVEDDANALYTILCVVHHRNDMVPQTLSPREVLQIAIEADKYDLRTALIYARARWLQHRDTADLLEMAYLMAAALLFDDIETFVEHGLALILRYTGSYLELLKDSVLCQILPDSTACELKPPSRRG